MSQAALAVPPWWLVVIFLSLVMLGRSFLKPNEREVLVLDNVSGLLRGLVVGRLACVWLIAVLRCSGRRTLAQLNAFDFIGTVALGSTLPTVPLSSSVAWSEGALALGLLAPLQFMVAWCSVHVPWVRSAVTSVPTVLLRDGQPDLTALARQRITEDSLRQAVRSAGIGGLELVSAVVLKCNGTISVISTSQRGSGSAITGLVASA